MLIKYFLCCLVLLSFGCNSTQKEVKSTPKKELVMAEVSEMAKLMNEMYAFNESIRQQIVDGNLNTNYPTNFDKIHTAVLTKSKVRGLDFEPFSKTFLDSEKEIFSDSQEDLTLRYNTAINACISCHEIKCVGPIPRIKKLLIKE